MSKLQWICCNAELSCLKQSSQQCVRLLKYKRNCWSKTSQAAYTIFRKTNERMAMFTKGILLKIPSSKTSSLERPQLHLYSPQKWAICVLVCIGWLRVGQPQPAYQKLRWGVEQSTVSRISVLLHKFSSRNCLRLGTCLKWPIQHSRKTMWANPQRNGGVGEGRGSVRITQCDLINQIG